MEITHSPRWPLPESGRTQGHPFSLGNRRRGISAFCSFHSTLTPCMSPVNICLSYFPHKLLQSFPMSSSSYWYNHFCCRLQVPSCRKDEKKKGNRAIIVLQSLSSVHIRYNRSITFLTICYIYFTLCHV